MTSSPTDEHDGSYTAYLLREILKREEEIDLKRVKYDQATDVVVVEHVAPNHGRDVDAVLRTIYFIAGVYIGSVITEGDADAETLDGRMWDPDGEDVIGWCLEAEWARRYLAEELKERDVLERLSETFERR